MEDENPVIGNNLELAQKSVEEARELSLQARAKGTAFAGGNLLLYMAHAGELISPWWSPQRDIELDNFWKSSDHVSGAMALLISKVTSISARVLPRDPSVRAHLAQAEEFTVKLMEESDFGAGWVDIVTKWLLDIWGGDNGGYLEIIGDGGHAKARGANGMSQQERRDRGVVAGPIVGTAKGIAHLDAHRCTRTGDIEYPVIYLDTDGSRYKYHTTRVAFASDLPSSRAEMLGVGFCCLSRAINSAQQLVDMSVYKQEKLGSRPKRAILLAKRISGEVILGAIQDADEAMDNKGLRRFSMNPLISDLDSDASLEIIELASLPDNFDEDTSTRLGMFTLAMAFGVPVRWIWPAAVVGGTKADAEFQHTSGLSGGLARTLRILEYLLGGSEYGAYHSKGKFLPPYLKLTFDVQDDWEDKQKADVKQARAKRRQVDLGDKVITVRVAREQALEAGDLTRAQFDQLELEEGRLPDGSDVLALFASPDDTLIKLLDLGFEDPLATGANDPYEILTEIDGAASVAQGVAATAGSVTERQKAQQALAALSALKGLYLPLIEQIVAEEEQLEAGEQELETAEKKFDYGVPSGEVIAGRLARGAGGRFVNVEELKEQIRQGIIQRLAARREGTSKPSKAELKKQQSRATVCEKLGLDPSLVDGLLKMRAGGPADLEALLGARLAKRMSDGSIVMSKAGRMLLGAANTGDVDKATEALAKAKEETPEEKKARLAIEKEAKRVRKEAERAAKEQERQRKKAEAEAEREEKKRQKEEEKRKRERAREKEIEDGKQRVADAMPEDLDLGSLRDFDEGVELSESEGDMLVKYRLAERARDGALRMTAAGKKLLAAADKGRVRDALDTLSIAMESRRTEWLETSLTEAEEEVKQLEKSLGEELGTNEQRNTEFKLKQTQEHMDHLQELLGTSDRNHVFVQAADAIRRAAERLGLVHGEKAEIPHITINVPEREVNVHLDAELKAPDETIETEIMVERGPNGLIQRTNKVSRKV